MRVSQPSHGFKSWIKLSDYWPILVFGVLSIAELAYFSVRGKGYDFAIFYEASRLTLTLNSPWDAVFDPIYAAYLNGPFTALLISPLGLFSESAALLLARGASILVVPLLVSNFIKYFSPAQELTIKSAKIWLSSSLILLTFPVRSNLEYGQFFVIFLMLFVVALRLSQSSSTRNLLLAGILIGICCDYKPQCFVVFGILIGFSNIYIIVGGFLSLIIGGIISIFLTGSLPYEVWVKAVLKRSEALSAGDQMHIYALLPDEIGKFLALVIIAILITYQFYNRSKFNSSPNKIFLLLVSILLTPWMHPTDLALTGVVVVAISIREQSFKFLNAFGLGCLLVWSSSVLITLFLAALTLFLLYLYLENKGNLLSFEPLVVIAPSIIFAFTSFFKPDLEQSHRQYWGVMSLLIATLIAFSLAVSHNSRKTLKP